MPIKRETDQKTTISVAEMRDMLGLRKTDSYWLVHKGEFKVIEINGTMRIDLDSFEEWYANQTHYRKVDGEGPGRCVAQDTFSVPEIAEMLGVCRDQVYYLLKRQNITTISVNNVIRVQKAVFWEWYRSQVHYRTQEDRERDRELEESSMTIAELGRTICIDRDEAYILINRNKDVFKTITIAGRRRITKESFETWYAGQQTYTKFDDLSPAEQWAYLSESYKGRISIAKMPAAKVLPTKAFYSVSETAKMLDLSEADLYKKVRSGKVNAMKVGHVWMISKGTIEEMIADSECNPKGGK